MGYGEFAVQIEDKEAHNPKHENRQKGINVSKIQALLQRGPVPNPKSKPKGQEHGHQVPCHQNKQLYFSVYKHNFIVLHCHKKGILSIDPPSCRLISNHAKQGYKEGSICNY